MLFGALTGGVTTAKRRFSWKKAHRIAGVDLTVLEGIDANTALVILRSAGATRGESSRAYLPPGGARCVTVCEVVLTGSLSSKHVTIEPCFAVDANALPGNISGSSTYVYTPVALTR
jgi:hypothetical protein